VLIHRHREHHRDDLIVSYEKVPFWGVTLTTGWGLERRDCRAARSVAAPRWPRRSLRLRNPTLYGVFVARACLGVRVKTCETASVESSPWMVASTGGSMASASRTVASLTGR